MLSYIYFGMTGCFLSTLETCLAVRLLDLFDFKPNDAALYFALFFASALICSIFCAFLQNESDKSVLILISLFLCSVSLLLIGPSQILHIPQTKEIIAVGLFLGGVYNPIAIYVVSQAIKYT